MRISTECAPLFQVSITFNLCPYNAAYSSAAQSFGQRFTGSSKVRLFQAPITQPVSVKRCTRPSGTEVCSAFYGLFLSI